MFGSSGCQVPRAFEEKIFLRHHGTSTSTIVTYRSFSVKAFFFLRQTHLKCCHKATFLFHMTIEQGCQTQFPGGHSVCRFLWFPFNQLSIKAWIPRCVYSLANQLLDARCWEQPENQQTQRPSRTGVWHLCHRTWFQSKFLQHLANSRHLHLWWNGRKGLFLVCLPNNLLAWRWCLMVILKTRWSQVATFLCNSFLPP